MKKSTPNSSTAGFSLIELVVALTLLAAIYGTMFKVLSNQKIQVIKTEITTKGIFLAQELMNRVLAKIFDEQTVSPWTAPAALGLELSDSYRNDVDDFNGYINGNIANFPGFTENVDVFYVNPDISLDNAVAVITDVKKIVVTLTHDEMIPIVLETIVSGRVTGDADPGGGSGGEHPGGEDDNDHHPGETDDDHHPGETDDDHHSGETYDDHHDDDDDDHHDDDDDDHHDDDDDD